MPGPDLAEHVRLLRDFANSLDVEQHSDFLTTPDQLTRWLDDQRLLPTGEHATWADHAIALDLRSAIRQAMGDHEHGCRRPVPELETVGTRLPLRITYVDGRPRLLPAQDGVPGALAVIVAAVADAYAEGSWRRLKLCEADDCRWAFYDTSKNRSRQWCSMSVCGNRNKTRAWRTRQRAERWGEC